MPGFGGIYRRGEEKLAWVPYKARHSKGLKKYAEEISERDVSGSFSGLGFTVSWHKSPGHEGETWETPTGCRTQLCSMPFLKTKLFCYFKKRGWGWRFREHLFFGSSWSPWRWKTTVVIEWTLEHWNGAAWNRSGIWACGKGCVQWGCLAAGVSSKNKRGTPLDGLY